MENQELLKFTNHHRITFIVKTLNLGTLVVSTAMEAVELKKTLASKMATKLSFQFNKEFNDTTLHLVVQQYFTHIHPWGKTFHVLKYIQRNKLPDEIIFKLPPTQATMESIPPPPPPPPPPHTHIYTKVTSICFITRHF